MNEQKISNLLTEIGLNKLEQDCYLALVKRSPQKASELVKKFSVHKVPILLALHRLVDKFGIVKRTKKKNTFFFLVEDVKSLSDYVARQASQLEQRQQELNALIPELRSMQNFEISKPKIYYFEGKDGIKQAFEQVLEEADEIVGYGSNEDDKKYLPEIIPDYYQRRVAKKIPVKAIIPALPVNVQETLKNEMRHLRETHLVPEKFNFPVQFNVYKDTVVFYSYEESFALMIKSRHIADCLKAIFGFAFDQTSIYDEEIRSGVGTK